MAKQQVESVIEVLMIIVVGTSYKGQFLQGSALPYARYMRVPD